MEKINMKRRYFYYATLLLSLILVVNACSEEEYAIPTPKSGLQNDCIKRSIGPNLVGMPIEFAYAMAILPTEGSLVSARVEASIPGAVGTKLENRAFYTNGSGQDVGTAIGDPSVTDGNITEVVFNRDTSAVTLRYYYIIPEEARGQSVKFTFSATDSNGKTVTYPMGPYNVAKMDFVLDKTVTNNSLAYISIADMTVYDAAGAAANPDKIDLVYLYRVVTKNAVNVFAHALVSPAADPQYLPGVTLPAGVNKSTKISKTWALRDFHLARLQYGIYIDDLDFQKLNIDNAPNFAINMKAESGAWVETADGAYRAYIYVNSVNNAAGGSMVISMKRYAMN